MYTNQDNSAITTVTTVTELDDLLDAQSTEYYGGDLESLGEPRSPYQNPCTTVTDERGRLSDIPEEDTESQTSQIEEIEETDDWGLGQTFHPVQLVSALPSPASTPGSTPMATPSAQGRRLPLDSKGTGMEGDAAEEVEVEVEEMGESQTFDMFTLLSTPPKTYLQRYAPWAPKKAAVTRFGVEQLQPRRLYD